VRKHVLTGRGAKGQVGPRFTPATLSPTDCGRATLATSSWLDKIVGIAHSSFYFQSRSLLVRDYDPLILTTQVLF
jgi:hypothetical protein